MHDDVLTRIKALSDQWHEAGTVPDAVLEELAVHARRQPWRHTMETGCGRTTLLLSHLSEHHTVFAYDRDNSSQRVFASDLLQRERVHHVPGSTQRTIPTHQFKDLFQLVLIDGPHSYPFPELEYYFVYPHIATGGLLVIDDIWIPTIHRLFEFLKEEPMFRLDKVVANTAFFIRTAAPVFDPYGDDWLAQPFNRRRFPMNQPPLRAAKQTLKRQAKSWLRALGLRREET